MHRAVTYQHYSMHCGWLQGHDTQSVRLSTVCSPVALHCRLSCAFFSRTLFEMPKSTGMVCCLQVPHARLCLAHLFNPGLPLGQGSCWHSTADGPILEHGQGCTGQPYIRSTAAGGVCTPVPLQPQSSAVSPCMPPISAQVADGNQAGLAKVPRCVQSPPGVQCHCWPFICRQTCLHQLL